MGASSISARIPPRSAWPGRRPSSLLAEFAGALRELRWRAGLPTFRTMRRRTGVSAPTLWRVEAGKTIPSLRATLAYVSACDGDVDLWTHQHQILVNSADPELAKAMQAKGTRLIFVPWRDFFDQPKSVPKPTVAQLRTEMRRLWLLSGLTLEELAERTKDPDIEGPHGLGISTISGLCNPALSHVPRRRTLRAFLLAVKADPKSIEQWMAARNQLAATHDRHLGTDRPEARTVAAAPAPEPAVVRTGTGEGVVDAGQQLLARFRRLRNDLTHKAVSSPIRIASVLESLGVDEWTASQLARHQPTAMGFVLSIDREMNKIMTEGRLPVSGAPLALELAVHRAAAAAQGHMERPELAVARRALESQARDLRVLEAQVQRDREAHAREVRRREVQAREERARKVREQEVHALEAQERAERALEAKAKEAQVREQQARERAREARIRHAEASGANVRLQVHGTGPAFR